MTQKQEDLLSVSLQVTGREREQSPDLQVGFTSDGQRGEIIVRYSGEIELLGQKYPDITYYELLNNYAIINANVSDFEAIIAETFIEYAEKPKILYSDLVNAKNASCIISFGVNSGADTDLGGVGLSGKDIIVAIADTGINPYLSDFKTKDNRSRIINIWDQSSDTELSERQITDYIYESDRSGVIDRMIPGFDYVGHGTSVARIACGNEGVAYGADIIVVKLNAGRTYADAGFTTTTELMRAVDYCVRKGIEYSKPVAINISYGSNYGDHTGGSILETYLDSVSNTGRNVICVGSGNEGLAATHTQGRLAPDREEEIEIAISDYETSVDIQIWKDYSDEVVIEIITPSGVNTGAVNRYSGLNRFNMGETTLLVYYGEPSPYNIRQEIYINLLPADTYIQSGIWTIRLIPVNIVSGLYDMWLPSVARLNRGTGFIRPSEEVTLTIPATAQSVITVGAYDYRKGTFATFSGTGYITEKAGKITVKPEIAAPGVDIVIDETTVVSGTSFAAPFCTGAAAMLMEWGIVRGNDRYMYNEKVKAYLIKGAKQIPGEPVPSERTGWGALCVADSIRKVY